MRLHRDGVIVKDSQSDRVLVSETLHRLLLLKINDVSLNLKYIRPHHIVGGIEICTSRGCIHKCTFCNIIGRESYQARSSENLIALLQRYEEDDEILFGENIPSNAGDPLMMTLPAISCGLPLS